MNYNAYVKLMPTSQFSLNSLAALVFSPHLIVHFFFHSQKWYLAEVKSLNLLREYSMGLLIRISGGNTILKKTEERGKKHYIMLCTEIMSQLNKNTS